MITAEEARKTFLEEQQRVDDQLLYRINAHIISVCKTQRSVGGYMDLSPNVINILTEKGYKVETYEINGSSATFYKISW